MDEDERRLQIALRLKAARHLVGHHGRRGATPMPVEDVVLYPPARDENITANRLTEVEQMKVSLRRSEMDALVRALKMPEDWFAGLYPSDVGREITSPLGAVLRAATEGALALRREREEAAEPKRGRGPR
jgi:hypothetical protein